MKVHYINILLFALPLNILVTLCHEHNQRNHKSTTSHTYINRSLCECELYTPVNYDSDPQMKEVIDNFNKQTQQRFREYDEKMKTTRQKCKDKCDKEIQKIILKDKLEKQMEEQLTTLETKINTDDIPTCICEKSIADKVEKECLKCAQNLGGIVAPSSGVLAGIAEGALYAWKPTALDAAIKAAIANGVADISAAAFKAGQVAGKQALIAGLDALDIGELGIEPWESLINPLDYTEVSKIINIIKIKKGQFCSAGSSSLGKDTCERIGNSLGTIVEGKYGPPDHLAIPQTVTEIVEGTKEAAAEAAKIANDNATAAITENQTALIDAGFESSISSINAAIIAIVVIILIMVIIYLILRYRRKKKMKKKLQYIKLLEE